MEDERRRSPGRDTDGGARQPVDAVATGALRPDEFDTYRTDPTAGDGSSDRAGATPGAEPRPWVLLGLLLLALFVGILAWAVVEPLL